MNNTPSVSAIIGEVKSLLEGQFRHIEVLGEVSNLSRSGSGHIYFSLSDPDSSLSCALFRMDALRNPEMKKINDGDKIIVSGSLGVYAKRGSFQLIAKRVSRAGKGDLKEKFEDLKKKLRGEGLFDLDQKSEIPELAQRVAVITAETGAALQDFLNITKRRTYWSDIILAPALVQGEKAPDSIRRALFNIIKYHLEGPSDKKIDVIVLMRGGGSLEDLWAFNDEALAWDIYNCPIPVISAVGHEVDFSISDLVADLRAETPSAAAELLSEGQMKIKERMSRAGKSLKNEAQETLYQMYRRLDDVSPESSLIALKDKLNFYQKRLDSLNPSGKLHLYLGQKEQFQRLEDLRVRLLSSLPDQVENKKREIDSMMGVLTVLDPSHVLSRGYSYLKDEKDQVIGNLKTFKKVSNDSDLSIQFADGEALVRKVKSKSGDLK